MKKDKHETRSGIHAKNDPNVYVSMFPQYRHVGDKERKEIRKIVDKMIAQPNETEPQIFS